jgi:hypothetical protein
MFHVVFPLGVPPLNPHRITSHFHECRVMQIDTIPLYLVDVRRIIPHLFHRDILRLRTTRKQQAYQHYQNNQQHALELDEIFR